MNQVTSLAGFMANGFLTTRLTAQNQLGIANLTAVVADLRQILPKDSIKTKTKKDFNHKSYAAYEIPESKLKKLHKAGYFYKINGEFRPIRHKFHG